MTRRYDEPVDVRCRDDAPGEFLWRSRLFVVREVLSWWVETVPWWQGTAAAAALGAVPAGATPAGGGTTGGGTAVLDTDLEVWRVEASAGRLRGTGVFDLARSGTPGTWSLLRTLD